MSCTKTIEQHERCCRCGGIILADTDEWRHPLCFECFVACNEDENWPGRLDRLWWVSVTDQSKAPGEDLIAVLIVGKCASADEAMVRVARLMVPSEYAGHAEAVVAMLDHYSSRRIPLRFQERVLLLDEVKELDALLGGN